MKLFFELLICLGLFALVGFIYSSQPRISCNDGKGWDGVTYYNMATQFQQGSPKIAGDVPFVKRLGTPYLVSKYADYTGKDILTSARDVNLAGAAIVLFLLALWLRRFLSKAWIRISLCILYLLAWHGPLRFLFYYPFISDVWGVAWLIASLLLMDMTKKKWLYTGTISPVLIGLLSLSIFIGIFFRESNAFLALAALFIINPFSAFKAGGNIFQPTQYLQFISDSIRNYFNKKNILIFLPLVLAIAATYVGGQLIVNTNVEGYSYIKTMMQWFYEKSIPEFILAIFIAYGPLVVLVPFYFKFYKSLLIQRQELTVLLLLALLFGYIGGSDSERIVYMSSFPIVFILIGICMEQIGRSKAAWWLAVLCLLQLLAYRVAWFIPDCVAPTLKKPLPFFTLMGQNFEYTLLYSGFGNYALNTILFIQYVFLLVATGILVKGINRRESENY